MTTATKARAEELELPVEDLQEFYDFLDALRKTGDTNMYGAGSYLETAFDMGRRMARKVLSAWMKDFTR